MSKDKGKKEAKKPKQAKKPKIITSLPPTTGK